ncbi:MAG: hypothetical protein HYW27_02975 [Candidatus Aenigmarchaeota archaeon]|nr:hypothetical protein [Candidatus Aenigmarchaeota archaeon]
MEMGMRPEDHSELNGIHLKPEEFRARRFAYMRELYKGDPRALQQIDIYDNSSPYGLHRRILVKALKDRDEETERNELAWFREHYPLVCNVGDI